MEKWGYFQQHEKYRNHITRLLNFGNSLKRDSGHFFKSKEAVKMVFGVRSNRVFHNFLLDPYYEPLLWFMIIFCVWGKKLIMIHKTKKK